MAKINIPVDSDPVDAEVGDLLLYFKPPSQVDAETLLAAFDVLPDTRPDAGDRNGLSEMFKANREFLARLANDEDTAEACRSAKLPTTVVGTLINDLNGIYTGRPTGSPPA